MQSAKKRSIVVIVVAALLLELTTAVQYITARRGITKQLTQMAQRDLYSSNRTAQLKQEVEVCVKNMLPEAERLARRHDTDSMKLLMRRMLNDNPEVAGIDFCYVVGDDGLREGVFIFEDDDTGQLKEHSIDFDFTQRSWYFKTLTRRGGFWSEPYRGKYREILMATYARPLCDADGKVIAVVGADVPMLELSAMATQLYENQQRGLLPVALLHVVGLLALAFIIQRTIHNARHLQQVENEKKRIEGELTIARNIQLAMLPKTFPPFPEREDIDIFAALTPAREVGGDFYDFLIRGDNLYFCIGDVSGKGVPAALVMAVARSMFRTIVMRESAPERIVKTMNDTIEQDNEYCMFITSFVGTLNLKSGLLSYCNAGHKAPLMLEDGCLRQLPICPNLPVGAFDGYDFAAQEAQIGTDTTIFLYTDGLTEAENALHDQFGAARMEQAATEMAPQRLIEGMTAAVEAFVGDTEQSDDLTMLALRFRPKNKAIGHRQDAKESQITLPCDINEMPRLAEFVETVCERAGLTAADTMKLNLALEEAVVNVMNYAYPPGSRSEVKIEALADGRKLQFTVSDRGMPFDPTTKEQVDITLSAEERPVGGLGIHLMRTFMDNVSYERREGRNILTMSKTIG
jgi:serine phosphatase RsbU (regulator of sigma subunit)/anti-sigma regulatory factor (Ser/Thr protein kinase)